MWSSFLVAMGGVMFVGLLGAVFVWRASRALRAAPRPEPRELEQSLQRIEEEIRHARELARASR